MDAIVILYPVTMGLIGLFFIGICLFGAHIYVYYKYAA